MQMGCSAGKELRREMWSARSSTFYQESGHIPQQGLARIEAGRKRQGLVPDFLVREPSTEGAADGLLDQQCWC